MADPNPLSSTSQVGLEMETRRQRPRTSLHQACRDGNLDVVSSLLEKVTRKNKKETLEVLDEDHQTPLHVAARFNRVGVIRKLLAKKANCKVKTKAEGLTALHLSARFVSRESDRRVQNDGRASSEEIDSTAAMTVLLRLGANLNALDTYGMTPLHHAVQRKNIAGALFLLSDDMIESGIDINIADKTKLTPLHEAIQQNCFEIAARLIELNADIMAEDSEGATPLHYASQEGAIEIGKKLYTVAAASGIQRQLVDKRTNENGTCLHLAVESGHEEMAKLCIQMGADVNAEMNNGWTPLHLAAKQGHLPAARLLIDARADIEAGDVDNATPLHVAARYNQSEMVEFLLEKHADMEAKDEESFTPLLTATSYGRTKIVEILLRHGADVEQVDHKGRTALHWAVKGNHRNTAIALLANETGSGLVNTSNSRSNFPLHTAAKKGYTELVKTLLKDGSIDAKNDEEKTPLHLAAAFGRVKVVRQLVAYDRRVINDEDEGSNMPIHLAALNGHGNVVETLLELGAQVDARNASFWTPLDCASFKGHADVVTILLEGDSPVDPQDKAGIIPLHLASREGHVPVVKLLLEWEADVSLKDHSGFNSLDYAIDHSRVEVAELIVKSECWMDALSSAHVAHLSDSKTTVETPMRKLIRKMPDVAEIVFTQCVTSNASTQGGITPHHPNFEVAFNYGFLDDIELAHKLLYEKSEIVEDDEDDDFDRKSISTLDSEFSAAAQENHLKLLVEHKSRISTDHPLMVMVKSKRERLLSHPLVSSLLRHKWRSFGRYVYYCNLFIFLCYLAILTTYATIMIPPYTHESRDDLGDCSTTQAGFFKFAQYFIIIFSTFRLYVLELYQAIHFGLDYLAAGNAVANIVEWVSFTMAMLFSLPLSNDSTFDCSVRSWQWQCGIVAVFLGWFNLLVFIRKLPKLGIYIVMFLDILKTFLQFLVVGALFVVAFGLSFYMLFTTTGSFSAPGRALVKTTVMTIGEFEFDDIFNSETNPLPYQVLSYILWLTFLIIMPILLMNLLIGLAVDDIKDVQESAKLQRLAMQVELVLGVEAALPSFIRHRFTRSVDRIMPNTKRSWMARLRDTMYDRGFTAEIITTALEQEITPIERLENSTDELREDVGQLKTDMRKLMKQNKRLTSILKSIARKQDVRVLAAVDDDDDDDDVDEVDGTAATSTTTATA